MSGAVRRFSARGSGRPSVTTCVEVASDSGGTAAGMNAVALSAGNGGAWTGRPARYRSMSSFISPALW
jgi:hypothetical protein